LLQCFAAWLLRLRLLQCFATLLLLLLCLCLLLLAGPAGLWVLLAGA
jgi:hypothetical protein